LRLLVEVVPDRAAGDAADGRADCRALPAARERAYARADLRRPGMLVEIMVTARK